MHTQHGQRRKKGGDKEGKERLQQQAAERHKGDDTYSKRLRLV